MTISKYFSPISSGTLNLPEVTEDGVVWKEGARPVSRDYTPLFFDGVAKTLTLDFFIHDGGVASDWAAQAQPGDALPLAGRVVRWWCRKIMLSSCMSVMKAGCQPLNAVRRPSAVSG